jgi:SAM-dependent methyltransferase
MQSPQFQMNSEIELRHWWFVARRRILAALIARVLPPSPQSMVVDIGCGTGGNIAALAERYACVGIDPSGEAIALARARFPQVRFIAGMAPDDLGEVSRQARLLLATDVLEHVPDDFWLFSRLLAATAPGAYFLLTVPADPSLWSPHDESHGHWRRYDRARLERLWEGLPVTPLLVSYFNRRLYPLVKLVRMVSRRRGKARGQAGTDFKIPAAPVNRLLTGIFAGESRRLARLLDGRGRGYAAGVSLVALLRREEGPLSPRRRPADVPADKHQPPAESAPRT